MKKTLVGFIAVALIAIHSATQADDGCQAAGGTAGPSLGDVASATAAQTAQGANASASSQQTQVIPPGVTLYEPSKFDFSEAMGGEPEYIIEDLRTGVSGSYRRVPEPSAAAPEGSSSPQGPGISRGGVGPGAGLYFNGFSLTTNVDSLAATSPLNRTQPAFSSSFQRLSSGLRIISSGDDAAGLAISNGFRSDIGALEQGVRNDSHGIDPMASTVSLQAADAGSAIGLIIPLWFSVQAADQAATGDAQPAGKGSAE